MTAEAAIDTAISAVEAMPRDVKTNAALGLLWLAKDKIVEAQSSAGLQPRARSEAARREDEAGRTVSR